jgi:hypothetical protein
MKLGLKDELIAIFPVVKITLILLLFLIGSMSLQADEMERFWRDFSGFENTLTSYGYDRAFSAHAKPEFVDAVIHDTVKMPSKQRLAEYLCVLYYMNATVVAERLTTLESSSSPVTRDAALTVRKHLKVYAEEAQKAK